MSTRACAFVSAYPEQVPCVALADGTGKYCSVHRNHESYSRVVKPRGKEVPVICACCQGEIKVGTLQKATPAGPVHGSYTCQPPDPLTTELPKGDPHDPAPPTA